MTIEPSEQALAPLIAQIETGLATIPPGSEGFVLTLENQADSNNWLQVSDDLINAAWPFQHEPEALFPAVCASRQVAFEAQLYATFAMPDTGHSLQARWIAHYFVEILGCDPSIVLTASVEDHGPVGAP